MLSKKARKYSQEYLNFGTLLNKWRRKTYVNEKALLVSYKLSYKIARCKRAHTIKEIVLGDYLGNDTVARRIGDTVEDF